MADRFHLIEAELREAPPREATTTREGRRKLILSLAPIAAALAAAIWLFLARNQPGWVETLFLVFVVACAAVLLRLVTLWLNRIQLVEKGVPIPAVVVYKDVRPNGEARYYAWYTVDRRQWGLGWRGSEHDAEIGDAVTVLHDASRPGRAIVYRWSGYCALNPKI